MTQKETKMKSKKVYILLGPTSSGKTSLVVKLCNQFDGEIISCDSRQICKYMNIGTGKVPTYNKTSVKNKGDHWLIDGVKVWGYDLVTPDDYFSAFDFAKFALSKISEIQKTTPDKKIFLVGGTGLYIDVLTGNVKLDQGAPNLELRNELEQLSLAELCSKLQVIDQNLFEKIDKQNKHRLMRAIERTLSPKEESLELCTDCEYIYFGLNGPRETLYARADAWANEIWRPGLLDETTSLLTSRYKYNTKLNGLIYKQAVAFLKNEISEDVALQQMKFALHAYIRRQVTYFNRMNKFVDIKWFDITDIDLYSNISHFLT